jgi:iron complex outermembrane receptor protein
MAAYGQGTYALLDNLKITAGIRFTHDEQEGGSKSYAPNFVPFTDLNSAPLLGPKVIRKTSDAPTWVLDLEYNPTPDMLTYVKYARGYRQGGVVPATMNLLPDAFAQYQPESVESYEVGVKNTFKGSVPGYANLALFYNDYSNQQLLVSTVCGVGAPPTCHPSLILENAQHSKSWGVELESSIRPFHNFRLDASGAYLSSTVTTFNAALPAASNIIPVPYQDVGGPLPFAPKWKAAITGTYTLPLPDTVGQVDLGATYSFNSGYTTTTCGPLAVQGSLTPVFNPYCKTDRTNLVDLNLNWSNIFGGPVDASFFVTNVLDETYATFFQSVYNSQGFEDRQLGPPRMFGGRIKLRFGADAHA